MNNPTTPNHKYISVNAFGLYASSTIRSIDYKTRGFHEQIYKGKQG